MGLKIPRHLIRPVREAMMNMSSATRNGDGIIDVTVTLPIRVKSESNQREHWAVKRNRTKQHRAVAGLYVERTGIKRHIQPDDGIRVTFTRIHPPRGKPMDSDNLAGAHKAARDGVADALGIDDGSDRYEWVYQQERGADHGVRVTIERIIN